ncbi:MAG TPA: efflux RND transporter periplasmic adaptor subunit [Sedimenticola sp.]|nr:efflux RND transporter periplasmic adaptor subunit [Sedimenticola sp.]
MKRRLLLFMLLFAPAVQAQEPPPARVVTALVEERELSPAARMVGLLGFWRVSEVAGEVEGLIVTHNFDTGTMLKKGEVLAELDTELLRKDIEAVNSQIAEAGAEVEKLALEVSRLAPLKRAQAASRSAYDEAFYSHKALVKRRDTLERQRERLQLLLKKSRVRAPFDGIVLEKKKELGDWLGRGEPLARLGAVDAVQVVVPVSESLLPFQHAGHEFDLFVPALGRSLKGRLRGVEPFAEVRSKSVYLKIGLPYEAGMIENLSVEVEVPTADPRRLRLIPRGALLQSPGADMVYTVAEGKAVPLPVHIVARTGEFIAVDDAGVSAGMAVVVDGNDRLRPGQAVQVIDQ